MTPRFDILGFGCVAVDDICHVEGYPPADAKAAILRQERRLGGLVGTALVAAARLGARCAYEGALGEDDLSAFAMRALQAEGIDLARLERNPRAGPVHSTIVVGDDRGTRNIFFNPGRQTPPGAAAAKGMEAAVQAARVLLIDHYDIARKIDAACCARAHGIPVVADFEGTEARFDELLACVDHLVLPLDFARKLTGLGAPAEIAAALWSKDRKAAVVTCGAEGCWFVIDAKPARHQPAFPVVARDTTGCGDVFHGAYALGLARGRSVEDSLRIAAAAAALKAFRPGFPCMKELEEFLQAGVPRPHPRRAPTFRPRQNHNTQ